MLDSDIIVDLLRGYRPAQTWIKAQVNPGVSTVAWLEVLQGAKNRIARERALKLLQTFEAVEVEKADLTWAVDAVIRFNLSHNVMAFDALIAFSSHRLQLPLYTRNLKHFRPCSVIWCSGLTETAFLDIAHNTAEQSAPCCTVL